MSINVKRETSKSYFKLVEKKCSIEKYLGRWYRKLEKLERKNLLKKSERPILECLHLKDSVLEKKHVPSHPEIRLCIQNLLFFIIFFGPSENFATHFPYKHCSEVQICCFNFSLCSTIFAICFTLSDRFVEIHK